MKQANPSFERPLLTIAIPTYNRAKYLHGSLSTLFDQLVDEPSVELIVSDNASSDETPAVIDEFVKRGLSLHYVRNEVNLGLDGNFLQCFEYASGKYLWLLGDDDVVIPGGLDKILQMLKAADYALVYLSLYAFVRDYVAERRHDRLRRFAETIPNGFPFIQRVGYMITFMSSIIVNKDRYSAAKRPPLHSFVGSNLIHLGWILPVLGSGGTSLLVWEKLLAGRDSYTGSWRVCETFGDNLNDLLRAMLPGEEDIAAAIVNPTLRCWFPSMIMKIRQPTAVFLNNENFRKLLEPLYKCNWRYWVYTFPVAVFPYWAARGWYVGTQQLNRAAHFLGEWKNSWAQNALPGKVL
jgi:glycosyltransferase involved in cell wall biosynthesis